MRNTLFFILLIGVFACQKTTPEQSFTPTAADTTALRHLKEVEWPKAYRESDTLLLDRILGDDFQMIDARGNWYDKAQELAWIKANDYRPDSFHYAIKRFEILENGTAIIAGSGYVEIDTVKNRYESSNYLVKRNGHWKAVASHVSGFRHVE